MFFFLLHSVVVTLIYAFSCFFVSFYLIGRHIFMGYMYMPDKTAETIDEDGKRCCTFRYRWGNGVMKGESERAISEEYVFWRWFMSPCVFLVRQIRSERRKRRQRMISILVNIDRLCTQQKERAREGVWSAWIMRMVSCVIMSHVAYHDNNSFFVCLCLGYLHSGDVAEFDKDNHPSVAAPSGFMRVSTEFHHELYLVERILFSSTLSI